MTENIKEVVEKWKAKVSLVEKLEKMSGRKQTKKAELKSFPWDSLLHEQLRFVIQLSENYKLIQQGILKWQSN
jgi:hypothetical protein